MNKPIFVYGLYDSRTESIFYIGMTSQPRGRLSAHRNDPLSAAHLLIKDIEDEGWECEMMIINQFNTRREAHEYEFRLIKALPGLWNIDERQFHYKS